MSVQHVTSQAIYPSAHCVPLLSYLWIAQVSLFLQSLWALLSMVSTWAGLHSIQLTPHGFCIGVATTTAALGLSADVIQRTDR